MRLAVRTQPEDDSWLVTIARRFPASQIRNMRRSITDAFWKMRGSEIIRWRLENPEIFEREKRRQAMR